MRYEVKPGDAMGWDASTGDIFTYIKDGETVTAEVIDTFPNQINFQIVGSDVLLRATYQELRDHQATYVALRAKAALPTCTGLLR